MPAGMNRVCKIIRFSYPVDDVVGGAVPSGTVLYENVNVHIKAEKPTQALLEQGLDTPTIFSALMFAGNLDIQFNDQIEIAFPTTDWFFGKRFRVIGIQRSSNHPAQDRNQIRLVLKRWGESHNNILQ